MPKLTYYQLGKSVDYNTKKYVEDNIENISPNLIKTGQYILADTHLELNGFLKCNGASISKTTYANLYNIIGDKYTNIINTGIGHPSFQQYGFNDSDVISSITSKNSWISTNALPGAVIFSNAVVTNNFVFLPVSLSSTNAISSSIYCATIKANGTLNNWVNYYNSFPIRMGGGTYLAHKNYFYALSGYTGNNVIDKLIYYAPINSDGSLGSWTQTVNLPFPNIYFFAFTLKDKLYIVGGKNSNLVFNTICYTTINNDGSLDPNWVITSGLPMGMYMHKIVRIKNYLYLLGGFASDGKTGYVLRAMINPDGSISPFSYYCTVDTIGYGGSAVICTNSTLALFGGYDSTNGYSDSIIYVSIKPDGNLSSFNTLNSSLPYSSYGGFAFITNGNLYFGGGYYANKSKTYYNTTIYRVPISGGLNNYMPYINQIDLDNSSNPNFNLPDYTPYLVDSNSSVYVKY